MPRNNSCARLNIINTKFTINKKKTIAIMTKTLHPKILTFIYYKLSYVDDNMKI